VDRRRHRSSGKARSHSVVLPAKAGIQQSVTLQLNISGAEYWIIRWSLSSGGALRRPGGG
jgi:hypothetical protein